MPEGFDDCKPNTRFATIVCMFNVEGVAEEDTELRTLPGLQSGPWDSLEQLIRPQRGIRIATQSRSAGKGRRTGTAAE
jgi:hypothetical protein